MSLMRRVLCFKSTHTLTHAHTHTKKKRGNFSEWVKKYGLINALQDPNINFIMLNQLKKKKRIQFYFFLFLSLFHLSHRLSNCHVDNSLVILFFDSFDIAADLAFRVFSPVNVFFGFIIIITISFSILKTKKDNKNKKR